MDLMLDISAFFQLCGSHCESQCEWQKPKWRGLMFVCMKNEISFQGYRGQDLLQKFDFQSDYLK